METAGASVTLVRTIKASPREVFAAWTDPAMIARWMGSPATTTTAEVEPRVGGRYRLETRTPDGVHVTTGEYRELVPDRRLVKTWVYEGPFHELEHFETLLTVELREVEPGLTELTLRHEQVPGAAYRESLLGGWTALLDNFEALAVEGRLVGSQTADS